ncbi:MAG TPA: quinol:electron acceptor oxidoreductase subunit ActD [Gemmatimonadaceae bacterium]|nr:quinol:electron acceptor oxidoreductase subunit ActD [Gemmatimonadaceae bacterium]
MSEPIFGVVGLFRSADELLAAIAEVKAKGQTALEAYTPYPVHGIDEALDLPKSKLAVLVFLIGSLACVSAFAFEWWTSTVGYPLRTAGKPYNGWQGWVLVMVEATILFSTFTAGVGMLFAFNKLPFFGHPMLPSRSMTGVTRDRFALVVRSANGVMDVDAATRALVAAGAESIEVVPVLDDRKPGVAWWLRTAFAIAAASVVAGYGTAWAIKVYPTVKPMVNMQVQPRLDAQAADPFFANGRGMQLPPTGTVARGYMPILAATPEDAGTALVNPLPITAQVLARGRLVFNLHCAVCHDRLGTGKPWLDSTYQAQPVDLQSSPMRSARDGYLYWVISQGIRTMPGYAADISQDDRWAVVRYIRALQRSQNAPTRDLK